MTPDDPSNTPTSEPTSPGEREPSEQFSSAPQGPTRKSPTGTALVGMLVGSYELHRHLGGGAMGDVYEATGVSWMKSCAIKVMRPGERAREALLIDAPEHPNRVQLFEQGQWTDPMGRSRPYVVMELIADAMPLTGHADAKKLDLRARLALVRTLCAAIEDSQKLGILHSDLKPANILVDRHGVLKVADFGVMVQRLADGQARSGGTLAYMSPEQCERPVRDLTPASEVFSIGVVLYELLTGRLPHALARGASRAEAAAAKRRAPAPPSTLHPQADMALDEIVRRALDPEPRGRYQHPHELDAALCAWLGGDSAGPAPLRAARGGRSRARARAWALARAGVGVVLSALIALLVIGPVVRRAAPADGAFLAALPPPRGPNPETLDVVRLVAVSESDAMIALGAERRIEGISAVRSSWRSLHAELVALAADARARAVVFDLYFPTSAPGHDEAFARAIDAAAARGTAVVVGVETFAVDPSNAPALSPALWASRAHWGALSLDFAGPTPILPLAVHRAGADEARPSLALAAWSASKRPGAGASHRLEGSVVRTRLWQPGARPGSRVEVAQLVARPSSLAAFAQTSNDTLGRAPGDITAHLELAFPADLAFDAATTDYAEVFRLTADERAELWQNRIVLVGDPHADARFRVGERTMLGVQAHAAGIEALEHQSARTIATGWWALALALVAAAGGWALGVGSVRAVAAGARRASKERSALATWSLAWPLRAVGLVVGVAAGVEVLRWAAGTFDTILLPTPGALAALVAAEAAAVIGAMGVQRLKPSGGVSG